MVVFHHRNPPLLRPRLSVRGLNERCALLQVIEKSGDPDKAEDGTAAIIRHSALSMRFEYAFPHGQLPAVAVNGLRIVISCHVYKDLGRSAHG
jgi:hypothetical protein